MNFDYSEKVSNEAREWFIAMQAEDINTERNEQFLEWFVKDSSHQKAYKDYQKILSDIAQLRDSTEATALKQSSNTLPSNAIQNLLKWISNKTINFMDWINGIVNPTKWAVVASFGVLTVAFFVNQNAHIDTQIYNTGTAEVATIHLDDGSEIVLSGKTTIKTWFTKKERHTELLNGQAFFKIAKNAQKPFWIDIDNTTVKVVGTAFDIHKSNDAISVAVSEGVVKVFNVTASLRGKYSDIDNLEHATLVKNQEVTNSKQNGLSGISQIEETEIASWRNGKLFFKNEKLKDVIADINRYYNGNIYYDKNIADLQMTAAISISQINNFPEILTQLLPVKNIVIDNNHVRLSAK